MNDDDVREWHYLRPLKSTTVPQSIIVVDTETYPVRDGRKKGRQRHHLRLWCASAWRLEKGRETREEDASGTTAAEFWDFVAGRTDNKRPVWVFCHNAGFDMTVLNLWTMAAEGQLDFIQHHVSKHGGNGKARPPVWTGIAVLDDPPTILKFRLANTVRTIIVVDTFNYFRCSLDEIGQSIGLDKGTMPPASAPESVWLDYCRQDVAVLKQAVSSLIRMVIDNGLGGLSYTLSGLAMGAYRKRFLETSKSILIHGQCDALKLERQSYHGGACHVWYLGYVCGRTAHIDDGPKPPDNVPSVWGPVHHLDVQSFYPSIMREKWFPCRLLKTILCPSRTQLECAVESRGVIADVWLDCPPPGFPITREGRTYYAAGRIRTVLPYPELIRAFNLGYVQKCSALSTYEMAPLFRDFVDYFWELRKEYDSTGNKAFAYVCKLVMNSLYGKFGQMRWKWQEDGTTTAPVPFGNWYERRAGETETAVYRALGWLPQRQQGKAEHPDSFPAIASYVTSYGRELILEYADKAGIDNCYYSDTDSLHTNATGYANLEYADLIKPGQLGSLAHKDRWDWAVYRGPKNYTTPEGDVIAGIKADATKEGSGSYRQKKFQRLASVLAGQQLDSIAIEDVLVKAARYYPVGAVSDTGRVLPPLLNEW